MLGWDFQKSLSRKWFFVCGDHHILGCQKAKAHHMQKSIAATNNNSNYRFDFINYF